MSYLIDTNVYVRAFTDRAFGERLRAFHRHALPRLALSAVVVHELLVGALVRERERALRRGLVTPFRDRGRLLTPSYQAWEAAAEVDRRLRRLRRYAASLAQRSFFNAILLAVTSGEVGATLITENATDFAIIAEVYPFRFTGPWPELGA